MKSLQTILTIGAVIAIGSSSGALAGNNEICPECRTTARLVLQSDLAGARSDYYVAVARANATPDEEDRDETLDEAREDFLESTSEAKDQYGARLDLCELLQECRYNADIDPADFMSPAQIAANPNPYWPMIPGTKFIYESDTEEGLETIEVLITDQTREIDGVECIVVKDTVWLEGEIIEDTFDWYAQDLDGNVWYFGELTFEYEDGEIIGLEGSWEAGEDGAQPGIIMFAAPEVGVAYRQELLVGEAEDAGQILSLNESVTVPYGNFDNCVQTLDLNPHSPGEIEHKYYAPGVGFVREVKPESGETLELIDIVFP